MNTLRIFIIALIFGVTAQGSTASESPDSSCVPHIHAAEQRHGIPKGLLHAIALVESGYGGVPHAWTLNIRGKPIYESSFERAKRRLVAESNRTKQIAIGCMQIFLRWHATPDPTIYLRPETGVEYAARYLKSLRQEHGSWTKAAARYHAGANNFGAQKEYVCRVWKNMQQLGHPVPSIGYSFCN